MNKIKPLTIFHIIIIVGLFFFTNKLNTELVKPAIKISKQDSAYEFGTNALKYLSVGNERFLSSIVWIKTLLESDEEHFKNDSGNSWLYYRFNTISILDPNFYENYLFGGKYLAIIKDDIYGASDIYNKGIKKFPDDYDLIKDSAFNYYFEIGDYDKAITLYKKILHHPRIEKEFALLPSILAKAVSSQGNPKEAYIILLNQFRNTKIGSIKKRLVKRLYALKAEIDLNCLNSNKGNCDYLDFLKNPYINNGQGVYRAKYKWTKFEIKKGRN
jgi:tetratricopeptide (TPR) repeat protein